MPRCCTRPIASDEPRTQNGTRHILGPVRLGETSHVIHGLVKREFRSRLVFKENVAACFFHGVAFSIVDRLD